MIIGTFLHSFAASRSTAGLTAIPFPSCRLFPSHLSICCRKWGFFTKIKRHSAGNGDSLTALYVPTRGSGGSALKKAQLVPLSQTWWPQGVSGLENPLVVCVSVTWTSTVCPHPHSHQRLETKRVLSEFLTSPGPCLRGKTTTCCSAGAENARASPPLLGGAVSPEPASSSPQKTTRAPKSPGVPSLGAGRSVVGLPKTHRINLSQVISIHKDEFSVLTDP